ncbi:histidine kinase [Phormidesmis priestleyi ULC007]|uniref:histidine kinase n=1 Tax=Phormidesmis priestleyi ULC007 TaxID=1920490 RepID=A0A2T1DFQ4_9CYAN|nr:GAF domain-containing sensor histidine kinase [Phormidesmis priestleyi]PSB19274.1 histidine kinase [Phormidesmis priestleyi ULC007]PZO52158.1 MAG: histidine kinase [Phormidesmis priestleyi]
MGIPESRLFCRLDGLTVAVREQQRLSILTELGLLETDSVPIFEEATQTAAHFLEAPIGILGLIAQDRQWFKSAVGLARLGLMNDLAVSRELPRDESFCIHVIDSHQVVAIDDTLNYPAFANSILAQQYGIRAYMGAPLITSSGECIGSLAVMDLVPRIFTVKDQEFLALTARLSMSEYERTYLTKNQVSVESAAIDPQPQNSSTHSIKFELLAQLAQELRTPLTSVMGMASVLSREIYGPLTPKQKEYLDIIHQSGQYLLSLVKEILELSQMEDSAQSLNLSSVDIEMLCQQAIGTLEQAAHRREQKIRLSVEPGSRIWMLDKEKIRQMLYHLMFSVIQASNAGSLIRFHVSHKGSGLRLTVWSSHPCFDEELGYSEIYASQPAGSVALMSLGYGDYANGNGSRLSDYNLMSTATIADYEAVSEAIEAEVLRKNLGLLLSLQLAEMHGGKILIQGGSEPGHRYVVTLPRLSAVNP